jgi:pimeloyl-ACP methyl ester carboxylesterase
MKAATANVRRDSVRLSVQLRLPERAAPPFPCVIFVHGLGSGKDSPRNVVVAERLVDTGIAALLFDLSGHGESDLDDREGLEPYVEDLEAVFHWGANHPDIDRERIGVAGSSLGGVVALDATRRRLIRPSALVLRAPPAEHHHFTSVEVPTLVIVGDHDVLLPRLREAIALGNNCTLSVVHSAGHLFEEPGTLDEASTLTVDWFTRNLTDRGLQPAYETGTVD